ncbi:MAG: 2-oxo acid dehydrogenase subunit E2, partial [Gammaproteobacteria bacterium]|nr:2-oxo acid dehydrogenase subunit E2 [Gammaproteobacteria bacterium]
SLSDEQIRETVQRFKLQAQTKSIPQNDLKDPTIVLSNFGAIAGRYANPIILPPTVAIVGVGRITKSLTLNDANTPEMHRMIPLSVSVDHRAITGGEVARFLRAIMDALQESGTRDRYKIT